MVQLWGTIRSFSSATAQRVEQRMQQICEGIAQAHEAEISLTINKGYPAVINDEKAARKVINHANHLFESDKVVEMECPMMAGEDFSFYQQYFPGAFFFVGRAPSGSTMFGIPKIQCGSRFFWRRMPLMVSLAIGELEEVIRLGVQYEFLNHFTVLSLLNGRTERELDGSINSELFRADQWKTKDFVVVGAGFGLSAVSSSYKT